MLTAYSQPTETINIPKRDALKVLAAADSAKIHKIHIALLQEEKDSLNARIFNLMQAREMYRKADSISRQELKLADQQMLIMADQKRIAQGFIDGLQKQIKKQRRKTRWTALAGVITTAASIIFIK